MRLLVIGGSDAGISAGLRARELDPTVEVILLVADTYPELLHLRAALLPVRRRARLASISPTAPAPTSRRPD